MEASVAILSPSLTPPQAHRSGCTEAAPQIQFGFPLKLALQRARPPEIESGGVAGYRLGLGRAQQPVERQARGARFDIPAGYVERADRRQQSALLSVVDTSREQKMPQRFGIARVAADQQRGEEIADGRGSGL